MESISNDIKFGEKKGFHKHIIEATPEFNYLIAINVVNQPGNINFIFRRNEEGVPNLINHQNNINLLMDGPILEYSASNFYLRITIY